MRKIFSTLYFITMAVLILSLSGCNGSSNSFSGSSSKPEVKQVAVLTSPVFQQGSNYQMYKGASLGNMNGAKYYVAPNIGTDDGKSTLNLGFTDELDTSLVIVDDSNNNVVFAYDPTGSGDKTTGSVSYDGGKRLKYDGLTITSAFFTSLAVDTSSRKVIVLDSSTGTATIDGVKIPEYNYVWHADPDHRDEYYTEGINGTTEMTESEMLANISDTVYIARDVRYMTSDLSFTGTAKNDEETEYAAYYSSTVQAEVAAELGGNLTGPYIFATLPMSEGAGGTPGGDFPGGEGPGSGDFPGGEGPGSGDFPGGEGPGSGGFPGGVTPASFRAAVSNSDIGYFSTMTHSASEAYANRVLHITEAGVYELQGTWNGQIWIEIGEEETDKAVIILNNVTVTCDVAPALVFREVYECGPEDEDTVDSTWKTTLGDTVMNNAGAMIIIADDSTNTFTGANVYRMLKPQVKKDSVTTIDGTDVSQQKKRYKMDGAFYSFSSMAMSGGTKGNGVLNVKSSTYEGFGTEMHMAFDSGVLTVNAPEDGMNFNEDDISTFVMIGGSLTVVGQGGDGIDSNGYIAIIDADKLDVTAKQDSNQDNAGADGPLDADKDVYISNSARANYTHQAYSGGSSTPTTPTDPASGDNTPDIPSNPDSGDNPPDVPSNPDSGDNPSPENPSASLTISTTSLADGTVGQYYSQTLTASDSSARWSLTSGTLPGGLTLSPLGTIQGNPTSAGSSTFTLTASSDAGTASKEFTITINAAAQTTTLAITSSATISATANSAINFTFTANLSGAAWSASGLPTGLTLNANTGALTGTLTTAGTYRFTVTASLNGQTANQSVVLTVTAQASDDAPNVPDKPASGDNTPDVPSNPASGDNTPDVTPPVDDEPSTPDDTSTSTETITTANGTTTVQIDLGSSTIETDTDTSPRGIATSDNVFRITRKVNTFSGITEE